MFHGNQMTDTETEDSIIFLLNNILMSVQFFENYERDIKLLRENWFKEVVLESHYKKCFHADTLFRLSGSKVKFLPRHGISKNFESFLHSFRIYVSSDNVEAAYDPSALGDDNRNVWPQYQFTVKTNENTEKSGCISLVKFKTVEAPNKNSSDLTPNNNFAFNDATETHPNSTLHRKSVVEEKCNRRLTKTEKLIVIQNKEVNLKILEKRGSLKYCATTVDGVIPSNGFYKFQNSAARLKPESIQEFRMNYFLNTSHEIPLECFQREDVRKKLNSRRTELNGCFRSQKLLNSAAFKGYFCDLLIERLSDSLSLDLENVTEGSVLEEFIIVNQEKVQYCIAPVITIRDWNNFVAINKKPQNSRNPKQLEWPSKQMQKIMNILPCCAVPAGHAHVSEENLDYEKTWKLVFPKAEEFLLLHMMHAHIRCYFFALLIYKSFIETEINGASFGPKHLLHLLFWRVHKNFLAWPEDRPGEILLNYLKALYRKLQNKSLSDFFITTRNLFASSLPKDLHKAQSLIKKIIERPVPYIIKAVRNLQFQSNFYPVFDVLKLNDILITVTPSEKSKKMKKQKKQKRVRFQDEEQQRIKTAIKQIELERKTEEQADTLSVDTIKIEQILDYNPQDIEKSKQILKMFMCHFTEMASKSIEFNFFSQALFYLHQTQKLFELTDSKGGNQDYTKAIREKINSLREICRNKLQHDFKKLLPKEHGHKLTSKTKNSKTFTEQKKVKEATDKQSVKEMEKETYNSDTKRMDDVTFSVKL